VLVGPCEHGNAFSYFIMMGLFLKFKNWQVLNKDSVV
jgi:hypothetical protein